LHSCSEWMSGLWVTDTAIAFTMHSVFTVRAVKPWYAIRHIDAFGYTHRIKDRTLSWTVLGNAERIGLLFQPEVTHGLGVCITRYEKSWSISRGDAAEITYLYLDWRISHHSISIKNSKWLNNIYLMYCNRIYGCTAATDTTDLCICEWTYSVSQKNTPPLRLSEFFSNFHKRLRIFNRFFTHLLYVLMYARLQIFVQLSPTLTKLWYIMRDYLVHLICAKCPECAKTRAFRRLRKSLIALLIVVSGNSL